MADHLAGCRPDLGYCEAGCKWFKRFERLQRDPLTVPRWKRWLRVG